MEVFIFIDMKHNIDRLKKLIKTIIIESLQSFVVNLQFGSPKTIDGKLLGHDHNFVFLVDSDDPSLHNASAKVTIEKGSFNTLSVKVTVIPNQTQP